MSDQQPPGARRAAKSRRAEKPSRADRARRAKQEPPATPPAARSRRAGGGPGRPERKPRTPALPGAGGGLRATAAVLVVAAVALAATTGSGATGRPAATQVGDLVSHQTIACPSGTPASGLTSRFAAGTLGAQGLGSGGAVRQGPVADSGSGVSLTRGRITDLSGVSGAAVLTATGQLAAGLFGFRVDSSRSAGTLATVPCQAPRADWWFTGAGATLDHRSQLVLANVDAGPAVVDVHVLGPHGPVDTVGTLGITLGPGDERTIPLDTIAPQNDEVAVSVHSSRGRVLASVSDGYAPSPGAQQGVEWLRGDVAPSRVVRIAGLPGRAQQRTLLVANPSDSEAVVDVDVAGGSGRYVPSGVGTQTVAPGAVQSLTLPPAVGNGQAFEVRLRSQVPVLGTVRSVVGSDSTDAPPVLPVSGESAAPVLSAARTSVELTAGTTKAAADVTAYDARGAKVDSTSLRIGQGTTVAWSPKRGAAYVVVSPRSGSVHGAVVYEGQGVAAFPLVALPIQVVNPVVVPGVG
ncbi:MAG: DUF5719 family protein [Oryzihumus sp.]